MTARPDSACARPLRVVYLGHTARLSGGEIALARLIGALRGVDAHVILAQDGPLTARLRTQGASVEILPMPGRTRELGRARVGARLPARAVLDTARYVLRLARRLRQLHPDVVHANTLKAGVYGSLAARLAGLPVVWHVRDRIAADYLPRPAVVLVRALIAVLPNAVIANSDATRRTLWRSHRPLRVVPSIVEPGPAVVRGDGVFAAGMIGRIAPWKGQDVFLRAFARAFPDGEERAVLVGAPLFGEDEQAYAARLRTLASSLGIARRTEFRGFREDVRGELARVDVCVHASTTPEPFGQVVVEAMSAGVPVVVAAAGGPAEIVTGGVDGLRYPPGDDAALAAALRALRDDAQLRARLAAGGRRRAAQYAGPAAAASVTDLYLRLADRAPGARAA